MTTCKMLAILGTFMDLSLLLGYHHIIVVIIICMTLSLTSPFSLWALSNCLIGTGGRGGAWHLWFDHFFMSELNYIGFRFLGSEFGVDTDTGVLVLGISGPLVTAL